MCRLQVKVSLMILIMGLLSGCSSEKYGNSVNTVQDTVQSTELSGETELNYQIKELLKNQSYELIWNVEDEDVSGNTAVWNVTPISTRELWKEMEENIFKDGTIQASEEDVEGIKIQMLFHDEIINIRIEDGAISIQGVLESDIYTEIKELLNEETGMNCTEVETETDLGVRECYYFQIDGVPVEAEGYGNGMDFISGSYYSISTMGNIEIMNPKKIAAMNQSIEQKEQIEMEDIKLLCETQWLVSGLPFVCVMDDINLVYRSSISGTELIPSYLVSGKFYEMDVSGNLNSRYASVLLDAATGEIIRFL